LPATYNISLVVASLLIAMFASYTALDMASRVSEVNGQAARWWLLGGSAAMGIGIWSMHFLGMLAFNLPVPMAYDPVVTFLSLLVAIASSAFALWMVCREMLSWLRLGIGAILMGAGVCTMHYTGMAAMRMRPGIRYIPSLFLLSVAIAITASGAALWIAFHLRRRSSKIKRLRVGAAVVMGLAIAGMHYTGMAAARFPEHSVCTMVGTGLSSTGMAPVIIVFALGVLSVALVISMFDFRTSLLASSLAHAHQELQFLAMHDGLTKLPNRRLLEDRLDQEIANAKRNQTRFSVLFLDLDGFKKVNDAFGHQVGDQLLIQVAQRIRSIVRARDTVARIGGDEFVLLADAAEPTQAASLAGKLIDAIQMPFVIAGLDCNVSASIGIALYGEESGREGLLKHADAAMYHAKALGRNSYCFYEASMNEDTQKQLQVVHDLRLALARHEFILYYQPKFDAQSGTILGVEALIRWKHPNRGILLPVEFIPLAERIGLILPIGEWTIQEACRQMNEWRAAGYTSWTVSINLSTVQFNHPGLIDLVCQNLERFALDPGSLAFEITESTAMRDPEMSLSVLQKLHQLGVRISIDDFGTGYSSLLYLKRLPARELKIDRGFVRDLFQGNEDAAIISAIVALGRTLNLEIVAEGVETLEQQHFLTGLGCNALQGFLLGRPMPANDFIAAIAKGRSAMEQQEEDRQHRPKLVAQIPSITHLKLGKQERIQASRT
jgi:diguanylate cyclase (GGDEF)-like protein